MAKRETTKFDEAAINALISEVVGDLSVMLKSEQEKLNKADPPTDPDEQSEGSGDPTAAIAPEGSPEGSPPPDEGSAPGGAPPMAPEGPPAGAPPGAPPEASMGAPTDQAIEPADSVETLTGEYSQLPPEALMMHYEACKAAIYALQGAAPQGAAPPDAGAGMPPAAPPGPPALKAEGTKVINTDGNGGEMKMGKAEKDAMTTLRKEYDEKFQKQEQGLMQLLEIIATPMRKSVKGIEDLRFIARTEEHKPSKFEAMTKNDISAILRDKIGKLEKKERDLVMDFYEGRVNVSKIEHLLG